MLYWHLCCKCCFWSKTEICTEFSFLRMWIISSVTNFYIHSVWPVLRQHAVKMDMGFGRHFQARVDHHCFYLEAVNMLSDHSKTLADGHAACSPAVCWSQSLWSASLVLLPLPSWQGLKFFTENSLWPNPPAAFTKSPAESSFLAGKRSRWHFGWVPSLHQQLAASCPGLPADTGGASTSRLRGPASRVLTGIPAYDSSYPPLWQLECGRNTIWPHPVCYSLLSQPYLHQAGLAGTKPERKAPAEAWTEYIEAIRC